MAFSAKDEATMYDRVGMPADWYLRVYLASDGVRVLAECPETGEVRECSRHGTAESVLRTLGRTFDRDRARLRLEEDLEA